MWLGHNGTTLVRQIISRIQMDGGMGTGSSGQKTELSPGTQAGPGKWGEETD